MAEFVVFRHDGGPNQAGVPAEKRPVARVEAASAAEACTKAAREVALTGKQYLTAEPAAPLDAREEEINRRVEAL